MKLKIKKSVLQEMISEAVTKQSIDKEIKKLSRDNAKNGSEALDMNIHGYAVAEFFVDDNPKIKKFLEKLGVDPIDYVSSRL
jgi:ribosomal protein L22